MADFVGGKSSLNLEEFSEEFVKQRTLYWLRKVKAEKMKELIANYRPTPLPRTTAPATSVPNSTSYTSPLHSLPPHHDSGHLPDPTVSLPPYPNQVRMPQPQVPSGGPFPSAAYTPYPSKQPPPRPAARQMPPGPPPPYGGQFRANQHRY